MPSRYGWMADTDPKAFQALIDIRRNMTFDERFRQFLVHEPWSLFPPVAKPSRDQRDCEKIGWQAKAPAPPKRKPLCASVGQTLSSASPVIVAIFSQTQRERLRPVYELTATGH